MMEIFGMLSGLLVGLLFGFALQRGRFCMNSAFRDPLVFGDFTILKAVAFALVVQLIGFHLLASAGVLSLAPKDFHLAGVVLGGLVFGIGMVIAGGCASGTAYRVGEGMISSMLALFAFAVTAFIAKDGALNETVSWLAGDSLGAPTLSSITGVDGWVFALVFSSAVLFLLFRGQGKPQEKGVQKKSVFEKIFKNGWNWKSTGLAIGFIGILAFVFSSLAGRNYPLGITMGFETILKSLFTGNDFLTWESFEVVGLVAGAFMGAAMAGEFKVRIPPPEMAVQSLFGGFLLGFGAVLADGCNIGHILSGVPQLAVASIVAGISIVIGAWAAAYILFIRGEKK